ncbi:MAG TPA: HEAT repeat domain-containing protein [Polyangiaceae bacterium]|nr:HEAT repeat domain-containing protein [Polyangiaceae bacterium]
MATFSMSAQDRARVEQVEALARQGREGLGELIALLDDPSWVVRRAVVAALARLGDDALGPLCDVIRFHRSNEARLAAAVDAVAASSGNIIPAMMELTAVSDPPAVLCDALQVLGRRKEHAALKFIVPFASHPDDNVAVAAIEAMGRIGGVETVEPLLAAVRSRNFFRTFPAIDALGRTGDPRAVEPLVALRTDPLYAAEATRALGRSGQGTALTALAQTLTKSNHALVCTAALALADLADHQETTFTSNRSMAEAVRSVVLPSDASARVCECFAGASASEQGALARSLGWLGDDIAIGKLVELLDNETPLAQAAAGALRTIGPEATPRLLAALRGSDSARRARILPLVGFERVAVEDIVACLEDVDPAVRALACEALARAGNTSVVHDLFRLLGDPDARVAQSASAAVQSLGSLDTKRLALEQARSGDPRTRRASLRIVSYFGYREGLDVMVEATADPDERIREAALGGLPLLDDPRAIEAILNATRHASPKTRAAAIRALGSTTNGAEIVGVLRRALGDEDAWVRYYACQSLSKLRVREAVDDIVARISDEAGQVRVAAVEALAHLRDPSALHALIGAAEGTDPDLRRAALLGLGAVRDPATFAIVRSALRSSDAATRLVAVSAIAEFDLPEVVASLGHAATDPHTGVSSTAIGFLSTRPGEAATKTLIELLAREIVRDRALAALAVALEGRTETILSSLESVSAEVAGWLISALVRMRRPSALAAIAAVLTFENVHARRVAASALAASGTREALDALRQYAASDLDAEVRRIAAAAAPG